MNQICKNIQLATKGLQLSIESRLVNVQYFNSPKNAYKKPIVLLTSIMKDFYSYREDVVELSKNHPLILVELPGFGLNEDRGIGLSFEELSSILRGVFNKLGFEKGILIGDSQQSYIAYTFACFNPERVEKLIISGLTPRLRKSANCLYSDSLNLLKTGDIDLFKKEMPLNHFNIGKRNEIENSLKLIQGFERTASLFTKVDQMHYAAHMERMTDSELLLRGPSCPTLVISGEFDHFTTPYENYEVSKRCIEGQCALVLGADNMGYWEKKGTYLRLYKRFIAGQSLKRMAGVKMMADRSVTPDKRQMEDRWKPAGGLSLVTTVGDINVVDLNSSGCLFQISNDNKNIQEGIKVELSFPDEQAKPMGLFPFKQVGENSFRGIFKHQGIVERESFSTYLTEMILEKNSAA